MKHADIGSLDKRSATAAADGAGNAARNSPNHGRSKEESTKQSDI